MRREASKFWDLVRLVLETLRYVKSQSLHRESGIASKREGGTEPPQNLPASPGKLAQYTPCVYWSRNVASRSRQKRTGNMKYLHWQYEIFADPYGLAIFSKNIIGYYWDTGAFIRRRLFDIPHYQVYPMYPWSGIDAERPWCITITGRTMGYEI